MAAQLKDLIASGKVKHSCVIIHFFHENIRAEENGVDILSLPNLVLAAINRK